MQLSWTAVLADLDTLTRTIGEKLLADCGQVSADAKADGSLVTRADRWADQQLRQSLRAAFPAMDILSEEGNHRLGDSDWCWVIDPIDGTTNFARGIPIWGISLGLLYQGVPVFGWVSLPPLRQTFYGFHNAPNHPDGAFLNGSPIHPSSHAPDAQEFFSLCARSTGVLAPDFPCKIRMLGAASYNLLTVAAGLTLGAVEATPKVWDIAAVWAIAQGAGATWIPLDGVSPFPLQAGQDYGERSFPTFLVSQPQWVDYFMTWIRPNFLQGKRP